jgi:hypothetical protein
MFITVLTTAHHRPYSEPVESSQNLHTLSASGFLRWSLLTSNVLYGGVSKSFRTESITKYTLATINTRREATQRVMAAEFTRLTDKIAIQLHLMAESYTICSSRSRRPIWKLLDTPSYASAVLIFLTGLPSHPYLITQSLCAELSATPCRRILFLTKHHNMKTYRGVDV